MDLDPDAQQPDAQPPDPTLQLPRDIARQVTWTLRSMLPTPLMDTPEAWELRNLAALAAVAALGPTNAKEASLAARSVAAAAHADDCLWQATLQVDDPKEARRLRAQVSSMGREERGCISMLLRLQAVRKKLEANPAARDSAAMTEHCVLGLMTAALESLPPMPPPAPRPPPAAAARAASPAAAAPAPRRVIRGGYDDWSDEEKRLDRITAAASRYAIIYPGRVKLIRQLGALPPDCDYEPIPPEVLDVIIHGTGSNLSWAETYEPVPFTPDPG